MTTYNSRHLDNTVTTRGKQIEIEIERKTLLKCGYRVSCHTK